MWKPGMTPEELLPAVRLRRAPAIDGPSRFSILRPDHWLTDQDIDAACFHLSKANPRIDGFQSTVLFGPLHVGGVVGTPETQFVQVLNIDDNHWVTASNIFCGPNEVAVYDSLNGDISRKTQNKLSWLLRPQGPNFLVRRPNVQKQTNGSNCGPFAIAFASVLCKGIRPEQCYFKENRLRRCLYSALVAEAAPDYDSICTQQEARGELESKTVEVHCICRTSHFQETMVQCNSCNKWYHANCVLIPMAALKNPDVEWNCLYCKA